MSHDDFQNEFQREVVDRLARLETMLSVITRDCPLCQSRIGALEIQAAKAAASTASAHHRIDGLIATALWAAGAVGAITAVLIQVAMYLFKIKGVSTSDAQTVVRIFTQ